MKNKPKKGRAILKREWVRPLIALLVLQLIFFVCDKNGWSMNFRDDEGTVLGRFSKAKLFTEQFVPYENSTFNLFTAVFLVTLLPAAIIGAMKDLFSRKQTNHHAG
ncbi:YfzA family protein [Priestia endophytica]|uniref:YfzA family protein n=1 Tax=Priestia endophytica TaxID=135735 RepID=UPI00227FB493|nr:YfzA family protein [Priestia endophytica]MCY8234452.1 YfzA family protein [Priestia endophytica]